MKIVILFLLSFAAYAQTDLYGFDVTPGEVTTGEGTFVYPSTGRSGPYREYTPVGWNGATLVFAHGFSENPLGYRLYAPLFEFVAARGYRVYSLSFPDAERGLRGAPERRSEMFDFTGTISGPVVVGGHSFGANTAIAQIGAVFPVGALRDETPVRENVIAAFLMSPQGVERNSLPDTWDTLARPMMSLTGTRDPSRNRQPWQWRTTPHAVSAQWSLLSVLQGGTHSFGNIVGVTPDQFNQVYQDITKSEALAFLDSVVFGDAEAIEWLDGLYADIPAVYLYEVRNKP
jgi:pimeloyl-ACP methyl ester carboxylesterase